MKNKFIILVSSILACLLILSGCSSTNNSSSSSSDPNLADKAFNETIDLTGVNKDKKSEEENGKRIIMDSKKIRKYCTNRFTYESKYGGNKVYQPYRCLRSR